MLEAWFARARRRDHGQGRRRAIADAGAALDAIPVLNDAVRVEERGDALILWVPLAPRWWMGAPFSWVLPFRKERGIALDSLGQEVWKACDGKRSVEQIVETFAVRHRVSFHEARSSVLQFLRSLTERRLLALAVPEPSQGEGAGA